MAALEGGGRNVLQHLSTVERLPNYHPVVLLTKLMLSAERTDFAPFANFAARTLWI